MRLPFAASLLASLLCLGGCGSPNTDNAPTEADRGARRKAPGPTADDEVTREQAQQEASGHVADDERPPEGTSWDSADDNAPTEGAPTEAVAAGGKTPEQIEADVRARALHDALGGVTSCFTPAFAATMPATANLNVTAYASGTGVITRAEVSGAFPQGILACAKNVVVGQHLPPAANDAPYVTSTSLEFTATKKTETTTKDVFPGLPTGEYKPPPGYVPPSTTLPAQGVTVPN